MVRLIARSFRASWLLRSAVGLSAAIALAACVNQPGSGRYGSPYAAGQIPNPFGARQINPGRRVAILLPLTGPNADLGQSLLKAAQLSFTAPGSPPLDQQDTGGTPDGAANAARAAVAAGDGIIIGPLTATETAAVAPVARAAQIPVLAFTSDSAQAQSGIWTLGLTPAQQVRRLVLAEQAENKTRISAVVPENPFGDALANSLTDVAASAGMPTPRILHAPSTFAGMNNALKSISDYANRRGLIEARQRAARASRDAADREEARELGREPIPPPPMDALFLGVSGDLLGQSVPLLTFYDIGPSEVRILGPATWARDAARQPNLAGAWYAAPDPALRAGFNQQYSAAYNQPPRDYASIAFDAAGIARAVATPNGFSLQNLTRSEGFVGADGLLGLEPNGQVKRGLAIFEIDRGGSHMVDPAPQSFAAPAY